MIFPFPNNGFDGARLNVLGCGNFLKPTLVCICCLALVLCDVFLGFDGLLLAGKH